MRVETAGSGIAGEIEIAAPPEVVFDALVTPEDLGCLVGIPGTVSDPRLANRSPSRRRIQLSGHFRKRAFVDCPRHLSGSRPSADPVLYVDAQLGGQTARDHGPVHLTPIAGGTRVQILHEGFTGFPESQSGHAEGWKRVLGWLAAYTAAKGVSQ